MNLEINPVTLVKKGSEEQQVWMERRWQKNPFDINMTMFIYVVWDYICPNWIWLQSLHENFEIDPVILSQERKWGKTSQDGNLVTEKHIWYHYEYVYSCWNRLKLSQLNMITKGLRPHKQENNYKIDRLEMPFWVPWYTFVYF